AEGEIPQHLEERVMPGGEAYVLEIIVLSARPHALLAGRGAGVVARLAAGEDVLELIHARVGEEQGRVVLRNERGALHSPVPPLLEEAEEGLADLGGGPRCRHGGGKIRKTRPFVTRRALEADERGQAGLEVVHRLDLGRAGLQDPPAREV